ncbi:hypothetical protein [Thermococcus piezophilus]|uniref:Uncharacterized protein n=1 Tax=Thermococcus piezophilus TaxID=1712654 RepID=A0A172WGZ6_9EURY|nr:hypothetical protein [Thermococcus piezophilus]ANF22576.1 hypothetical protein A7C91_04865 [Thermococcus piezophilus]
MTAREGENHYPGLGSINTENLSHGLYLLAGWSIASGCSKIDLVERPDIGLDGKSGYLDIVFRKDKN